MKTLTIFATALLAAFCVSAQTDPTPQPKPSWNTSFGMNYGFTLPRGSMKPYIRNGNGLMINFMSEAPSKRIAAGIDFNFTTYGHSKRKENYTFPDGSSAPMNIVVNNNVMTLMAVSRLYLVLDGPVRPYATLKAGYTWFNTSLTINDPDDADSCKPVESDMLQKDGTFAYSAGGGVRLDLAWIFKRRLQRGYYFLDVSSNMLQGGRVNYMNEDAPDPSSSHNMNGRAKDVEAQFINTQTQVVHSHHVGYLYNSFVSMMDFRLGFSMRIMY